MIQTDHPAIRLAFCASDRPEAQEARERLAERYGEAPPPHRTIALSPGGRQFDDALAGELAAEPALTLLCGRYEGFDERVHEHLATDVISIGQYVLSGGELAAMVVIAGVAAAVQAAYGNVDAAKGVLIGVPAVAGVVAGTALQQRLPTRAIALGFAALLVVSGLALLL